MLILLHAAPIHCNCIDSAATVSFGISSQLLFYKTRSSMSDGGSENDNQTNERNIQLVILTVLQLLTITVIFLKPRNDLRSCLSSGCLVESKNTSYIIRALYLHGCNC